MSTDRWFPTRARSEGPGLPLFCIPHAGGGASTFGSWLGRMPGIAVMAVQPPGRENRLAEPAFQMLPPLVDELADRVQEQAAGRPFAVYGHSHGALIGYELVRELRRRGEQEPLALLVSGAPAPHVHSVEPAVTRMSKGEVVAMLRRLGGTPEWLLSDPDALQMILPAFVGDFAVRETYVHEIEEPITLPVTLISSDRDPRVSGARQRRWQEVTTGFWQEKVLGGGHFAVYEQAPLVHRFILEALAPWLHGVSAR